VAGRTMAVVAEQKPAAVAGRTMTVVAGRTMTVVAAQKPAAVAGRTLTVVGYTRNATLIHS
jgi:hypothetical protein